MRAATRNTVTDGAVTDDATARTATTGGDAVVAALVSHGVNTVFGIPGVHSLALYDALHRDGTIRHVLARHEQGAGFMAEGYARATGRPGVALVTSGPAVTNVATPAASSYTDSVPLLVIATDLATKDRGAHAGVLHELKDQAAVAGAVVGWQRTVQTADQIQQAVHEALEHLQRRRPRGAIVCIPHDLLEQPVRLRDDLPELSEPAVDADAIGQAADLLSAASRPLIVAGAGLRRGESVAPVLELSDTLQAPILLGPKSHDVVESGHRLAFGGRLFLVPDEVQELLESCDATVVLGSKLAAERTNDGRLSLPHPMIRVDIDPMVMPGPPRADVAIVADAAAAVPALIAALRDRSQPARTDPADEVTRARAAIADSTLRWVGPDSQQWMAALRDALPDEVAIVADMTMLGYASSDLFDIRPGGRFVHPFEFCAIGCGLPTAIGVKAGRGDRPVLAIAGDGGSLLNIGELATAVQERLDLVYVIFNDSAYTAVAGPQERTYGARFATDLVSPDFAAVARAFGAAGVQVSDPQALRDAVREALGRDGSTVIDVQLRA